jgi:UDP-galactose transporter B1
MQMFQHLNKWKSCLSLLYSLYNYEFLYLYEFFVNHPTSLLHMMGLILTNALGQIVIYWMITCFRQHVVPFVITTRKLFTVGISILYFKHDVTWVQIMGIIIVFIIVCYDFIDELTIK